MNIHKIRSILYLVARILGDVQAVKSGSPSKMAKRVGRRIVGKAAGKMIRRLFR